MTRSTSSPHSAAVVTSANRHYRSHEALNELLRCVLSPLCRDAFHDLDHSSQKLWAWSVVDLTRWRRPTFGAFSTTSRPSQGAPRLIRNRWPLNPRFPKSLRIGWTNVISSAPFGGSFPLRLSTPCSSSGRTGAEHTTHRRQGSSCACSKHERAKSPAHRRNWRPHSTAELRPR